MVRFVTFLLLAASLPFAFAHNTGGGNNNNNSCGPGEFFFSRKSCCVTHGGPPNPPPPPKGSDCPPSGWSWHPGNQCCVPHHPPPPNGPPPQCRNGWKWDDDTLKCCPNGTPSNPPPSTPSGQPGHGGPHGGPRKRDMKSRAPALCPQGLEACPIPGLMGTSGDFECLDTDTELESCGGCASIGAGQDCSAIPGVWNVGCESGSCVVTSCQAGYRVSHDKKSCIAL